MHITIPLVYAMQQKSDSKETLSVVSFLVRKASVVRISLVVGVVVRRIGVIRVLVDGASVLVFGKEFLHFPVVLFGAHGELEIFAGDGVPILWQV